MTAGPYWFSRPPMEGVIRQGSFRAYGHTIGPAQKLLAAWVAGRALDPRIDWQTEYINRPDPAFAGHLKIAGTWQPHSGTIVWSATFAQAGYPDRYGMAGGCGSAEDACDRALDLVREDEAERVAEIVVGIA